MSVATTTRCLRVDSHTFEREVLNHHGPVLVDFYAEWCAPCRRLAAVLETIAERFDGRIRVAALNVDENPELADAFRIGSLPALKLIAGGRIHGEWTGYRSEQGLAVDLERILARMEQA